MLESAYSDIYQLRKLVEPELMYNLKPSVYSSISYYIARQSII
jgi:hypothetical protein